MSDLCGLAVSPLDRSSHPPHYLPGLIFPRAPPAIWHTPYFTPLSSSLSTCPQGLGFFFFFLVTALSSTSGIAPSTQFLHSTSIYQINDWVNVLILKTYLALLLWTISWLLSRYLINFLYLWFASYENKNTDTALVHTFMWFIPMFTVYLDLLSSACASGFSSMKHSLISCTMDTWHSEMLVHYWTEFCYPKPERKIILAS